MFDYNICKKINTKTKTINSKSFIYKEWLVANKMLNKMNTINSHSKTNALLLYIISLKIPRILTKFIWTRLSTTKDLQKRKITILRWSISCILRLRRVQGQLVRRLKRLWLLLMALKLKFLNQLHIQECLWLSSIVIKKLEKAKYIAIIPDFPIWQ